MALVYIILSRAGHSSKNIDVEVITYSLFFQVHFRLFFRLHFFDDFDGDPHIFIERYICIKPNLSL